MNKEVNLKGQMKAQGKIKVYVINP